ncbi:PREDICTED: putative phospholipase B-like 2 [Branchiostoma belcheri]|uniref:Phospholipase B-like n=1 Tax=Branchiostoma belcheri TaxID=7741 RepID=A0A6P5AX77_BRABE|nr:PREDICTED: putative phospholipase B-like 2 [Branchiostoma belcheri]
MQTSNMATSRNIVCGRMLSCLLLFSFVFSAVSDGSKLASVRYDEGTKTYQITDTLDTGAAAWANFTDRISSTGWSFLTVTTNEKYNDSVQAYAAGLVEGYLTRDHMYNHWLNTVGAAFCSSKSTFCKNLESFLKTNLAWMKEQIEASGETDDYWHQVKLTLQQLSGLDDGYNDEPKQPSLDINPFGFLIFQISGDMEDLQEALKDRDSHRVLGSGSCSALVKLLPGNTDLFVAHDTWNTFQSMLRIIKKYQFPFNMGGADKIPGHTVSFSSYPGVLYSGDDFYITSSSLVAQETTNGNSNPALWKYVQPQGQVLEWLRNIVANRLANKAMDWANIFKKYNSGTYNNQWMIVDYKAFTPNKYLPEKGLLVVLEQLPGMVVMDDVTSVLAKQAYWPSYNTPYFEKIFNASGMPAMVEKYGDWFTYEHTPRANIFRRDHEKVTDVSSMIKLMRYNDFQHDPLSRCNCTPPYSAENSISARSDLNPINGTYPFGALQHRCHGGTDMKMTSYSMYANYEMMAVSGPTHDQQPAFQWSTSDYDKQFYHLGHPDIFNFDPVHVIWYDQSDD